MSEAVTEVLTRMGGVARWHELVAATSRRSLDEALADGAIVRLDYGTYGLASADEARIAARRLKGTVSHLSAAMVHGWRVKTPPSTPHVTLGKGRKVASERCSGIEVHRAALHEDDLDGDVTSIDRTLVDCLRSEPFDSALAVADSALRSGVDPRWLVALAENARGRNVRQIRAVAEAASPLAANPFESVLRAVAMNVPGLSMVPQVPIYGPDFVGQPDLVDRELGIVAEADSFEWHGGRRALRRDARRYNELAIRGWLVLRFAWEDVMHDQAWVHQMLLGAVTARYAVGLRTSMSENSPFEPISPLWTRRGT